MTVKCTFDSEDDVIRNGNILEIENDPMPGMVIVSILDKNGKLEDQSVVDGMKLIKAIQNAMNS